MNAILFLILAAPLPPAKFEILKLPTVAEDTSKIDRNIRAIITSSQPLKYNQMSGNIRYDKRHKKWYTIPNIHEHFRRVAVEMELLDPRETWFFVDNGLEQFLCNICTIQARYQALKDAPPLSDVDRFPDWDTIIALKAFNRNYLAHLTASREVVLETYWHDAAIAETELCYKIYDLIHDARMTYSHNHVRRNCLLMLKQLIGDEQYYGRLPPHVPIWRFKEID